jgi:hypothetical protein
MFIAFPPIRSKEDSREKLSCSSRTSIPRSVRCSVRCPTWDAVLGEADAVALRFARPSRSRRRPPAKLRGLRPLHRTRIPQFQHGHGPRLRGRNNLLLSDAGERLREIGLDRLDVLERRREQRLVALWKLRFVHGSGDVSLKLRRCHGCRLSASVHKAIRKSIPLARRFGPDP